MQTYHGTIPRSVTNIHYPPNIHSIYIPEGAITIILGTLPISSLDITLRQTTEKNTRIDV